MACRFVLFWSQTLDQVIFSPVASLFLGCIPLSVSLWRHRLQPLAAPSGHRCRRPLAVGPHLALLT
jgi:hypothetical protein